MSPLTNYVTIWSDKMVRRSAAEQEDLKSCWKSEKNIFLLEVINRHVTCYFTSKRKKTIILVLFCCRTLTKILKDRDGRSDFSNFWKVQLISMKVQVCSGSSAKPSLEYTQDQIPLKKPSFIIIFSISSGVTERWCSFRLVLEGEVVKVTRYFSRHFFTTGKW